MDVDLVSTEKTLRDKRKLHSTSRLESILSKIQNILTDYCEFRSTCPYFNPENYTCANNGGSHCGKYRKFEAEKIEERKL
jgi:uncharacterized protein YutD